MTQTLTPIERRVYHYLLDFTAENTFQPSIREIGRRFGIRSTKTVSDILQALAAKGFIERDASRSRGVRLLGFAGLASARPVPYYGRIHAGEPALLPEHRDGFFTVDRRFLPSDGVFMLRVSGDSMNGAGLLDGDYVLVDPDSSAKALKDEGAIAAIRVGEEAALKHVVREGESIILRAANPGVPDERVAQGTRLDILGTVCGIFRPMYDSGPAVPRDLDHDSDDGLLVEPPPAATRRMGYAIPSSPTPPGTELIV